MNLAQAYKAERAERAPYGAHPRVWQQPAAQALRTARARLAWNAACGYIADESDAPVMGPSAYRPGRVRLMLLPDSDSPADDFDGSERDLNEARERANRDGMWGIQAEYWDGSEWQWADSVWGFIGDEWKGSGYDIDLMQSALDGLAEVDAEQARVWEAERPDLYTVH